MKKNTELLLAGIAVVVIVASLLYIFSYRQQEFAFSFEAENVLFASNVKNPGEQLRELSRRSSFLVVSDFLERGTASFMTQPITFY
ncbi:MAG: hypothetical protein HYW50_01395 [Candidatus Diapherotrites archaeon]|nr:hypothetical protein [Candidatus Diapherotrites archaeon]